MAEPGAAAVIAEISDQMVGNCISLAPVVLVLYEYLVTLGPEVRLFWRREITGASILFFINRYLVLSYNLLLFGAYLFSLNTISACHQYMYATKVLTLLCYYIPWAGFSALRVFALTGGNWLIAPTVFVLSLGPVAINFASLHWFIIIIDPVLGCVQESDASNALSLTFLVISRVSLIAADLIVLIVTWVTTYKTAAMSRTVLNDNRPTLSSLLLRDGTLYFLVMLAMNVLHLVLSATSMFVDIDIGDISYITLFSEPLTSILVSRFMMNLQDARRRLAGSTTGGGGAGRTVSSLRFDRVVGSIGGSLGPSITDGDIHGLAEDDEAEGSE